MAISDRYFDDLLVDPVRYRYGAPRWLARLAFKLAPQPNLVFVLDADSSVIYGRKQEVALSELERQLAAYREMAHSGGDRVKLIAVDRTKEEIAEEILWVIESWWAERSQLLP